MRLIALTLITLSPLAFSLPQAQPRALSLPPLEDLEILRHSQLSARVDERAFGAGDSGFVGTSVAGDKDTSTLTSLVVFHSEPTQTSSSTSSESSSSESEDDQIVSPFYPSTTDDEDDSDNDNDADSSNDDAQDGNTSLQSLSEGQTAAFNPTPSTTLTFLSNSLATAATSGKPANLIGTGSGTGTGTGTETNSQSAVVAAASGNSTSAGVSTPMIDLQKIGMIGGLGMALIYLI
ncbi:uncharacterized protein I303_103352 [Kwoniella dejecticola CBS 10117]|uniref:Uncharacterized protein n=1 Tax=Kwoniella dejecticola CBS 10117 TaxID=1296121 RepID=A0A1A6A6I7_9TREE|nr:uncharacterized protein I303_03375 [Kwoniella dejecticola CBS 10117]OBR85664.1 hypothetical protein I303_03375 [Kwoniella dejecticola CBS 10117]